MNYEISDKELIIEARGIVKFKYPISKVANTNDILVVMLSVPFDKIFNENIFGVSYFGEKLWQISKVESTVKNNPYVEIHITPSMQKHGEKFVKVIKFDGMVYEIRPETGQIMSSKFTK